MCITNQSGDSGQILWSKSSPFAFTKLPLKNFDLEISKKQI